jgi:hypothetical protein
MPDEHTEVIVGVDTHNLGFDGADVPATRIENSTSSA